MARVEDPDDFIAVSVAVSEYARKWGLEGRPAIYKLYASRYNSLFGTWVAQNRINML